jgi:hypothetical protein
MLQEGQMMTDTDTKKALQEVRLRWNYADVIALVTAHLPGTQFKGDRSAWLRGVCELTQKYPHLLRGVHFIQREPFTPYSHQVDEVLKMLGRWEYKSDFNPKFRRIEVNEEGKQELRASLEPKLRDHLEEIRAMANILKGYVSLEEMRESDANDLRGAER